MVRTNPDRRTDAHMYRRKNVRRDPHMQHI